MYTAHKEQLQFKSLQIDDLHMYCHYLMCVGINSKLYSSSILRNIIKLLIAIKYWVGQKVHLAFFCTMALVVFNSICNNFVRLCCDSCHMSVHFLKSWSKSVKFCAATLILKMEEHTQNFWCIMLIISRKIKAQLQGKNQVCGEGAVMDRMRQKWFVKFLHTIDILAKWFFAVGLSYALEGV